MKYVDTERIAELLEPYAGDYAPSVLQLADISTYIDMLLKWNARTNLTGIRAPEEMVRRHFGESWFAAHQLLAHNSTESVVDIGAGAGFPGMVLKLFAPAIHLMLVESHGKKATFLKELSRVLEFTGVEVANERAEHLSVQAGLVTLRAVEKFEDILPVASRLTAPGGRLALMIGAAQFEAAQTILPGKWRVIDFPEAEARVLAVRS